MADLKLVPNFMECYMWVSIIAPGWGSHITRQNSDTVREKGEVGLKRQWSDLDPYPLVGTSIFYHGDPNPR